MFNRFILFVVSSSRERAALLARSVYSAGGEAALGVPVMAQSVLPNVSPAGNVSRTVTTATVSSWTPIGTG